MQMIQCAMQTNIDDACGGGGGGGGVISVVVVVGRTRQPIITNYCIRSSYFRYAYRATNENESNLGIGILD